MDDEWTDRAKATLAHEIQNGLQDKEVPAIFREKELNIFLRNELDQGNLTAYVRDAATGEVLQMPRGSWLQSVLMLEHIPTGIYDDFIFREDDPYTPGPPSFVGGVLQNVFFRRQEFDEWLGSIFSRHLNLKDEHRLTRSRNAPVVATSELISNRPTAHRRAAAIEAIIAVYGHEGPPVGVGLKLQEKAINEWLKQHGRALVSGSTIARALSTVARLNRP